MLLQTKDATAITVGNFSQMVFQAHLLISVANAQPDPIDRTTVLGSMRVRSTQRSYLVLPSMSSLSTFSSR